MPKDAATTQTLAAAQPVQNVAGGLVVHIALVFDGVAFNPANLLNALRVQYGRPRCPLTPTPSRRTHTAFGWCRDARRGPTRPRAAPSARANRSRGAR